MELVAQRLLEAGSQVTRPRDDPEGFQEIITSDPDGNTIRLFAWPNAMAKAERRNQKAEAFAAGASC